MSKRIKLAIRKPKGISITANKKDISILSQDFYLCMSSPVLKFNFG